MRLLTSEGCDNITTNGCVHNAPMKRIGGNSTYVNTTQRLHVVKTGAVVHALVYIIIFSLTSRSHAYYYDVCMYVVFSLIIIMFIGVRTRSRREKGILLVTDNRQKRALICTARVTLLHAPEKGTCCVEIKT